MGSSLFFSCFTLTFLPSSRESVWSGPDFLHSFCAHSLLMDSQIHMYLYMYVQYLSTIIIFEDTFYIMASLFHYTVIHHVFIHQHGLMCSHRRMIQLWTNALKKTL